MIQVERMVRNLCDMVQIPSESGEEQEFIKCLYRKFTNGLSANCYIDDYGNFIARIPACSCSSLTPLFFAMHADTVKPGKEIQLKVVDGFVYSSGDTILGVDCKAGIAEFIEAIQSAISDAVSILTNSKKEDNQ